MYVWTQGRDIWKKNSLLFIFFHTMKVSAVLDFHYIDKTFETFFKMSSFVFHIKKKGIQV